MFLWLLQPAESITWRIICIQGWRNTLGGEGDAVGESINVNYHRRCAAGHQVFDSEKIRAATVRLNQLCVAKLIAQLRAVV